MAEVRTLQWCDRRIAELEAALRELLAIEEDGDGLWDQDGGAPGECAPYQSERLASLMKRVAQILRTGEIGHR